MLHEQISGGLPQNPPLVFTSKTVRSVFVVAMRSSVAVSFIFLTKEFVEDMFMRNCLSIILCVGFGAFSYAYFKRNLPGNGLFGRRLQLIIVQSLLFSITIILASYFIFHTEILLTTGCVAAFLLPACVEEACLAFRGMPGVAVIIWQPADEQQLLQKRVQYKKDLSIHFVLIKKTGSSSLSTITWQASKHDLLGHAFNQLTGYGVAGIEHEIDMSDDDGYEFEWAFYTADRLLGKKWFDPYATFRQNNIQAGIPVFVKRIKSSDI